MAAPIDFEKLTKLLHEEEQLFIKNHPKSAVLYDRAKKSLFEGVPMHWMIRWEGKHPIFVKQGKGARFQCVDGRDYLDLCLGDTGAMTGHSPPAVMKVVQEASQKGITYMLPTEDGIIVAEELQKRFGLKYWQMALTATDANRFSIRLARHITDRRLVLVYNWCYHGSVADTFVTLDAHGKEVLRPGNIGPPNTDPTVTTRVVEFNDLAALERALQDRKVAVLLAEPVMTNIGIIHPHAGYWAKAHALCKQYGTLLIIDETHTMCTGHAGYTGLHGLTPDFVTLGKAIGSGIPAAVYGFSEHVASLIKKTTERDLIDVGGLGGTLAGNALSLAVMRATLTHVLTPDNFKRMIALGDRFERGVQDVIREFGLPWIVKRLGCRVEYWFRSSPPVNGHEAETSVDPLLDKYMHLASLNRGILMTPFHNMALMCPDTTQKDVDYHTKVFREITAKLVQAGVLAPTKTGTKLQAKL